MAETCAKCSNQTVCAHTISLDTVRATWRVCCLCAAELINALNGTEEEVPSDGVQ